MHPDSPTRAGVSPRCRPASRTHAGFPRSPRATCKRSRTEIHPRHRCMHPVPTDSREHVDDAPDSRCGRASAGARRRALTFAGREPEQHPRRSRSSAAGPDMTAAMPAHRRGSASDDERCRPHARSRSPRRPMHARRRRRRPSGMRRGRRPFARPSRAAGRRCARPATRPELRAGLDRARSRTVSSPRSCPARAISPTSSTSFHRSRGRRCRSSPRGRERQPS